MNPSAPANPFAIGRQNYTVVSWDNVGTLENGTPITDVLWYRVYRSKMANEYDRVLLATITTTDAAGKIDHIHIDTSGGPFDIYRITAGIAGAPVLESDVSNAAMGYYVSSQIDAKSEILDDKLGLWDVGVWDESLFS